MTGSGYDDGVADVLSGLRSFDDVDSHAQVLVRIEWEQQIATHLGSMDLGAEFRASGTPYAELDEDGTVVVRHPDRSCRSGPSRGL